MKPVWTFVLRSDTLMPRPRGTRHDARCQMRMPQVVDLAIVGGLCGTPSGACRIRTKDAGLEAQPGLVDDVSVPECLWAISMMPEPRAPMLLSTTTGQPKRASRADRVRQMRTEPCAKIPAVEVRWTTGVATVRCPVCCRTGTQELLAMVDVAWRDDAIDVVRCRDCAAVVLSAVRPPSSYRDTDWDDYIEHVARIEAIADMLAKVGAPAGARMLDVGCGYGFGIDLAQFLFKWKGTGLDPSIAARRGRTELGLDIRPGTMDECVARDERFDVIFASEVLEHLADPRSFLASARRCLSTRGVLLLTTPDASIVRPDAPLTALHPALSVGAHQFLVTANGLGRLLRDAGFEATVWCVGSNLQALAAASSDALRATQPTATALRRDLVRYCAARAATAQPGSPLAVGMAARQLEYATNARAYEHAAAALAVLRSALCHRYGVTLDSGASAAALKVPRPSLVVAHYFAGVLALRRDRDPRRALDHFVAAGAVARAQYDRDGEYLDPHTPLLEVHALGHRAVILTQIDRAWPSEALDDLDAAIDRGPGAAALERQYRDRVQRAMPTRSLRIRATRSVRAAAARAQRRLTRPRWDHDELPTPTGR
jgi:SAM-dependent methyltransferase